MNYQPSRLSTNLLLAKKYDEFINNLQGKIENRFLYNSLKLFCQSFDYAQGLMVSNIEPSIL